MHRPRSIFRFAMALLVTAAIPLTAMADIPEVTVVDRISKIEAATSFKKTESKNRSNSSGIQETTIESRIRRDQFGADIFVGFIGFTQEDAFLDSNTLDNVFTLISSSRQIYYSFDLGGEELSDSFIPGWLKITAFTFSENFDQEQKLSNLTTGDKTKIKFATGEETLGDDNGVIVTLFDTVLVGRVQGNEETRFSIVSDDNALSEEYSSPYFTNIIGFQSNFDGWMLRIMSRSKFVEAAKGVVDNLRGFSDTHIIATVKLDEVFELSFQSRVIKYEIASQFSQRFTQETIRLNVEIRNSLSLIIEQTTLDLTANLFGFNDEEKAEHSDQVFAFGLRLTFSDTDSEPVPAPELE